MQITANEIDSVEDAGLLNGNPVKLIKMKGGFWIAVSRLKNRSQEEAIGAGSHPAIVKYNLAKQYPEFQPSMQKSDLFSNTSIVEKHSHFLDDDLRKSGHDIYSVQNGLNVSFQITKHNNSIAEVKAELNNKSLTLKGLNIPKEFSKAFAGATVEKAMLCNVGLAFKSS